MIEFSCPNRKYDGTPVICDLEVMAFAEAQVEDYKPALLREPAKINAIHFVESYLEASVDAQNIWDAVKGMEIGGITVFKDTMIMVDDDGRMTEKFFPAGSIIIDSYVMRREDGFSQFTAMRPGISVWETDDPQGAGLNLWTGLPIGTARSIVCKNQNSNGVLRQIMEDYAIL